MSELFSIQLQNRQQQGRDGVWLDLPTTTEQVQAALRQIGISSDNPQGLFISGYFAEEEKRFAIPYNMVLASNVDELNFLASRLETLSTGERAELNAALQAPQSELFSIGRITDFPENVDYYVHLPDVHGPAQLGDYYLNRSGMVDMPEEWKGGIDTAQFGRYVAQQEQGVFTEYGYLVKSGDEWQKVHEGQPVPEEYRVLSFPAPEVLRDAANIPPPVQPETEPQKVIPIILNGKDSAERMKEITDRLETGIQELFDSDRYNTWKFCGEQTHDRILAYAVELTGAANGTVQGNLYELDYQQHFQHIREAALPVGANRLIYESGMREIGPKEHFDSRPDKYFGELVRYEMQPLDPELLQAAIRQEQRSREPARPGNFKEHLAALHTGLIEAEAQRIAADIKRLAAPNSPDKNHFMVEVSPYFTKLASSRDTNQLLAMLPYKSLHLSSVKDRFGIYALVDKNENRDKNIRKPRASVRKQLSETKQTASPIKASARRKQYEMEV